MNTNKFSPLAHKMMCISQVTALDSAIKSAQGKSFHKSIEKAMLLLEGYSWLKSPEGITYLKEVKKQTQEEAVKEAYGLLKAQYSLNIRIAKATLRIPNLVEKFLALCDAKQGAASYSIQNLDNYVKKLDNAVANPLPTEGSEEGEFDGEGVTEGSVDVDTKAKPIVTFTFNGEAMDMKNVSLRITDKGELKTSSSAEDVAKAIAYLQGTLLQLKAETKAKVEVKAVASLDKPKAAKVSKFKVKPLVSDADVIAEFEASLEPTELVEDDYTNAPF